MPEKFFATVTTAGADLRGTRAFADHHSYTPEDAHRLLSLAGAERALLVTTEKDHVRLTRHNGVLAALAAASRVLPIQLLLDAASHTALQALIAQRCPKT